MKKQLILIICLVLISSVSCFPSVYGATNLVGQTTTSGSSGPADNQIRGFNVTTNLPVVTGVTQWYVTGIYIYAHNHSANAAVKALIVNNESEIVAVSSYSLPVDHATGTWFYFNFTNIAIYDNYAICSIGDSGCQQNQGGTVNWIQDETNSFSSPVDPTDANQYEPTSGPVIYAMLTSDSGVTTPAPLPTGGSYQSTDTDTLINTFTGYLIPLILFLLPALILGWVTHWAKWPILIGLAIGSGLTYLFLGTQYIWLVVMVIIGIASMSYADYRGGG